MDLDRLHHAVRALVKGGDLSARAVADLSTAERRALASLRRQIAALDASPLGTRLSWIARGALWVAPPAPTHQ